MRAGGSNYRRLVSHRARVDAARLSAVANPLAEGETAPPPISLEHSAMPSFDIVSEVNTHEVVNAVDQANREVGTRFDFKGTGAKFELQEKELLVTLTAQADFQLKQMMDVLTLKLSKRGVDVQCMKVDEPVLLGQTARQTVTLRQGIETELGKKIQRLIKDAKLKVQAAIQDKQVRVTGKSRDDLQEVIAMVRKAKLDLPMQFTNFRD